MKLTISNRETAALVAYGLPAFLETLAGDLRSGKTDVKEIRGYAGGDTEVITEQTEPENNYVATEEKDPAYCYKTERGDLFIRRCPMTRPLPETITVAHGQVETTARLMGTIQEDED